MYKLFRSNKNRRGSGLIGFLVVIFIIGIVLWYMTGLNKGIDSPSSPSDVRENLEKGTEAARQTELNTLKQAISLYRAEHGRYPDNLQILADEDYIAGSALTDPDGEPYSYNPEAGEVSKP